jgi:hypothetical protein
MGKKSPSENQSIEKILERLKELELRISGLENHAVIPQMHVFEPAMEAAGSESQKEEIENEGIESKVGEYGMAWLGNIVLLFGIIFLLQFFKNQGYTLFSSVFGFASVAGVYLTGYLIRQHYPHMARLFTYNGHLLIFVVTLRLHFTSTEPLVSNKAIGLVLLLMVIAPLLYVAFQKKTQILTAIVMLMTVITAILSDSTPFMLTLMILISGYAVFFVHKFGWWKLLMLSIFFVYSCFLLWSLNNPIMTHVLKAVETLQYSYLYLFACAFIYSMLALLPGRTEDEGQPLNVSIILNGLGFSFIIAILILKFFKDNYYFPLGVIAAFGVAYSALLESRGQWKLSAALYALYGFALLSITIGGIYKFPLAFFLLAIQSLLVVSMALWFRSKFIVVMNVVMFTGLLIAYFFFPKPVSRIDFTFALVALITARIINWKRDRLEIKTELLRNTYLFIGFIMTLLSLYRSVPQHYITFSWTMAAGLFFVLSILLHNVKYRWLAISTMIVTAFYFFLFDLSHVSIGYRIVALMFIAVISLSFSIYYSKRIKKKKSADPETVSQ